MQHPALAPLPLVAALLAACEAHHVEFPDDSAGVRCGEGTHLEGDTCVPDVDTGDSSEIDTEDTRGSEETGDTGDTDTGATETGESGGDSDSGSSEDTGDLSPGGRWAGEHVLPAEGVPITGERNADGAGWSIAAGDADGDGAPDLLVGAPYATRSGREGVGRVYLVRGPSDGPASLGDAPLALTGDTDALGLGGTVAVVGDLDGDGGAEVAASGSGGAGAVFVLPGGSTGELDAGDVSGRWVGEADGDLAGYGLGGGDWDGDGLAELAVGAPGYSGAVHHGGAVYVLHEEALDGGDLRDASVRILNTAPDAVAFGSGVLDLGDLDGDGVGELGAAWSGFDDRHGPHGALVVYPGPLSGAFPADEFDGYVAGDGARLGDGQSAMVLAGDADNDGLPDLLLGDPAATVGDLPGAGAAWLVSGAELAGGTSTAYAVARFEGSTASAGLGAAVAAPGDIDDDGEIDVVLGEPTGNTYAYTGGAVYLWYGSLRGTYTPEEADAGWFSDQAGAELGRGLVAGVDLDGDRLGDLIMGARQAVGDAATSGSVYLVPGLTP